ncbi:hypothetical protein [Pasteurella oralis]|uniref:PFGI-1 class ICE element type IV pilus protein PilL2 n=1 Tax=Pasteurella oralis TaxID=1071947 RepID=UPI000C7D66C6|nr:hypothetical protein [Pasteurella oralis]
MNKLTVITTLLCTTIFTGCAHTQKVTIKNEDNLSSILPTTVEISPPTVTNNTVSMNDNYRIVDKDIYLTSYEEYPEVIRYGRYTLVTSTPIGGQKYLLDQLVNINIPVNKNKKYTLNVKQGINYTLKDTGYILCQSADKEVLTLFDRQLPKVHYKFGSMRLRDALQMLAGEAYQLTVNDTLRQVCFKGRTVLPPPVEPRTVIQSSSKTDYSEHE